MTNDEAEKLIANTMHGMLDARIHDKATLVKQVSEVKNSIYRNFPGINWSEVIYYLCLIRGVRDE